jgi:hypothetical protein
MFFLDALSQNKLKIQESCFSDHHSGMILSNFRRYVVCFFGKEWDGQRVIHLINFRGEKDSRAGPFLLGQVLGLVDQTHNTYIYI